MKRFSFLKSIYARTLFRIALAILIIFIILGTTYFALFISATRSQEATYLRRNAEEMSSMVAKGMNSARTAIESPEIPQYISLTASLTDALVWLVNANGEIIYNTGIPVATFSKLDQPVEERQYYRLPLESQNRSQMVFSQIAQQSDLGKLLPQNHRWMVASAPLVSFSGAYAGEIILLRSLTTETHSEFLQNNLVPISFLIAFLLALIVLLILSRDITKPISILADTADRVYRGDLTARAFLPAVKGEKGKGNEIDLLALEDAQDDDLLLLMKTFNMLIAKFEEQEKERADFMSSISHDLRSPITSIRGFVEGILDDTIPEDQIDHYLKIVQQESKRLQQLVNELFEMTTVLRKEQMKMGIFDMNELIEDVLDSHEPLIMEKNISVQLDLIPDESSLVVGNDEAIQRVLVNMLANSIRFCPQNGSIKISSRLTAGKLYQFIIEDDGIGLAEEDIDRVFDRLYKADKARNSEGSGLGLFIAKNIINAHGQSVEAGHSKMGGALFTFTLDTP